MHELVTTPVMSAYSERDAPSENGFSLPPISLKLTPSPDDLDYADDGQRSKDGRSHYSSRASSFMFSRRSSRMSTSMSNSPTKFPTIDRNKSNSMASLSTARSLAKSNAYPRDSLCKSPSCPQLQWDDDMSSEASSLNTNMTTMNGSAKQSVKSRFEELESDMKLPSISPNKGKAKRDSSLPRIDSSGQIKGSLTDREPRNGQSGKRDHLHGGDTGVIITPRIDQNKQSNVQQTYSGPGGAFLLPIREADKAAPKSYGLKGKKKNKSKGQETAKGNAIRGFNGIIQVEGDAIQSGRFELNEEDEFMDINSGDRVGHLEESNDEVTQYSESHNMGKTQKKANKNKRR